jgi:hypothetical protein
MKDKIDVGFLNSVGYILGKRRVYMQRVIGCNRSRKKGFIYAGLTALLLFAAQMGPARADTSRVVPFATRNQNPLVAVHGLPLAESATVLGAGKTSLRLGIDAANSYTIETGRNEGIVLDGETWRVNIAVRYGLGNGVELGIEIPYVSHSGGMFDPVINSWHDITGLPDGNRESTDNNQLAYQYITAGRMPLDIDNATSGLGDVRVSCAFRLYGDNSGNGRSLSLHAGIKLPTGESSAMTGSGGTDLSVSLAGNDRTLLSPYRLTIYGSGGIVLLEGGRILEHQQRNLAGFGTAGIGWRPLKWLIPKIQVDWHSPFYSNSDLDPVNSWSAQLVLGGTIILPGETALDLAVVEDVIVDSAPDVVFHVTLRRQF